MNNRLGQYIVMVGLVVALVVGGYVMYKFITWTPTHYKKYYDMRRGL